ncbi:MAG TPA: ABC transporter permease subunit [Candidatus Sulfotelmatobacter sp.]|jgi:ABC-2 type transport system permease protein|nr:ABC transporter permease subunit [Candidatus Sulfotelmatobacter sp.]
MFFYQLKNELWKLFGKKRTYIGFSMLLLAQLIIILMLRFYPPAHRGLTHSIEASGFFGAQYISMLTIATIMAFVLAYTLLPLYVALVGGDLVSKEYEDGTLRMILSRPVSRVRLLFLKWLAGVVFSFVLVVSLAAGGLIFSGLMFPITGGSFTQFPDDPTNIGIFPFQEGLQRFLLAHAFMVLKAVTIMSLAFMFSCFNMKPAAAAILALSIILIDRILMEIPFFHDLKEYFLGHYLNAWQTFYFQHLWYWHLVESAAMLCAFSLTFLIIGLAVFQVRDIKS